MAPRPAVVIHQSRPPTGVRAEASRPDLPTITLHQADDGTCLISSDALELLERSFRTSGRNFPSTLSEKALSRSLNALKTTSKTSLRKVELRDVSSPGDISQAVTTAVANLDARMPKGDRAATTSSQILSRYAMSFREYCVDTARTMRKQIHDTESRLHIPEILSAGETDIIKRYTSAEDPARLIIADAKRMHAARRRRETASAISSLFASGLNVRDMLLQAPRAQPETEDQRRCRNLWERYVTEFTENSHTAEWGEMIWDQILSEECSTYGIDVDEMKRLTDFERWAALDGFESLPELRARLTKSKRPSGSKARMHSIPDFGPGKAAPHLSAPSSKSKKSRKKRKDTGNKDKNPTSISAVSIPLANDDEDEETERAKPAKLSTETNRFAGFLEDSREASESRIEIVTTHASRASHLPPRRYERPPGIKSIVEGWDRHAKRLKETREKKLTARRSAHERRSMSHHWMQVSSQAYRVDDGHFTRPPRIETEVTPFGSIMRDQELEKLRRGGHSSKTNRAETRPCRTSPKDRSAGTPSESVSAAQCPVDDAIADVTRKNAFDPSELCDLLTAIQTDLRSLETPSTSVTPASTLSADTPETPASTISAAETGPSRARPDQEDKEHVKRLIEGLRRSAMESEAPFQPEDDDTVLIGSMSDTGYEPAFEDSDAELDEVGWQVKCPVSASSSRRDYIRRMSM